MKDRWWKRIINNRGYLFGTVAKLNKICLNYRGFYFELILSKIPVTYRSTISVDDKFEILIVIKFLDLKFDTNWTYLFSYLQMTAISCLQASYATSVAILIDIIFQYIIYSGVFLNLHMFCFLIVYSTTKIFSQLLSKMSDEKGICVSR